MDPITIALGLAQLVPSLMRLFGAKEPTIEAAGKVISVAQVVTGANSPEEALAKLQVDQAKQLEFQLAISKQESEIAIMLLKDVQDARARDVALKANGGNNVRGDILAYLAIGALITVMYLALFLNMENGPGRDLILMLSGTLVAVVKDVYNFEFGSTRVSKQKDDTITNLTK